VTALTHNLNFLKVTSEFQQAVLWNSFFLGRLLPWIVFRYTLAVFFYPRSR